MRTPGPAGRLAVAAGAATWTGAAAGLHAGLMAVPPVVAAALLLWIGRRRTLAAFALLAFAGMVSGSLAADRLQSTWSAEVPEGRLVLAGRVAEDGKEGRPGIVVAESVFDDGRQRPWPGPPLAVNLSEGMALVAGERVRIDGTVQRIPGRVRGDPVAGHITARRVERLTGAGWLFAVGNALRGRVDSLTGGAGPGRALLSGFLIGDTSRLTRRDLDALRRSGLTHFVAVSGSNVALFLLGWWLVTAVFGAGSRRRFALGLLGLGLFVIVTRWEASVLRAATMAALILGGAAAGIAVDGWTALGTAVALLLLTSGQLAVDVGFQLSVAATAGILLGAGMGEHRSPRWAWTIVTATLSAQLAVLPILLFHFGTVPLLSPVANLMAAPLVGGATVMGALGVVTAWEPLIEVAAALAGLVLSVARLAAGWPQLGVTTVVLLALFGGLAVIRSLRPILAVAGAVGIGVVTVGVGTVPGGPTATILDVGQGDAVLLRSGGEVALIDGGQDPLVLADKLRAHGVGRIDLLVVTHGDIDHVGGLDGILSDHGVGRLWVSPHGGPSDVLDGLIAAAGAVGVEVERVGARSPPAWIGSIEIQPIGPGRRYAADNDGSVVLWVEAGHTMLLAGDAEAIAQRELPPVRPDVLLVPHHGSASTDVGWLSETLGDSAVVSVGANTYGHPAPEIMAVLAASDAEVFVTRDVGDIVIPLG